MRKITLALAFLASTVLISAFPVHATTYSRAVVKAPGVPTLADAFLAFNYGSIINEPKNVTKWLDAQGVPEEYRPVVYSRYKGVIYGIVIDPFTEDLYGFVAFKGSGEFITFLDAEQP